MAGTYSQMHIQLVFATKNHQSSFIKKENKDEVEKYITGIIIRYILNQEKHHRNKIFR